MSDDIYDLVSTDSKITRLIKEKLGECVNGIRVDVEEDVVSLETDDCSNLELINKDGKQLLICRKCSSVFLASLEESDISTSPDSEDDQSDDDEFFSQVCNSD